MELDQYQRAWKADAAQTRVSIDADLLAKEVQRSQRGFQSTIFWRDVREAGTSLVLIPIWFAMGISQSLPWSWYLMVPALMWVAGFILVDRSRHPQRPSEPGEPLLYYVKEALTQVEHQIWLLRNVFWWYLLPFCVSMMAFFLDVAWQSSSSWWEFVLAGGLLGLFLFVVDGAIYLLNQRAVRTQLVPRRQELLKLIASVENESNKEDTSDIIDLVLAIDDPARSVDLNSNWESWAENWNRIVPSWRVVAAIVLPTLVGAYCGLQYPLPDMGPVFFQSVVAAVIPFEIAFLCVYLWSRKKLKQSVSTDRRPDASALDNDVEGSANQRLKRLPKAPAIVILFLIVFLSVMAVLAIYVGAVALKGQSQRGPEQGDVSAFNEVDIAHTDVWLQKLVDSIYPSLSVVVVSDGQVVYKGAFGFEDIQAGSKATAQTQYNVASVTKVFTASLALILHERGVVDLDQPVVTYLPEGISLSTTPEVGATITLRQLASHTSGLPRNVSGQVQSVDGWYELEPQRLYDQLAKVTLESVPGTAKEYSNLGFGLLGHALERAADKPFDRLLQEIVCVPLQLERTAIQADATLRPATGYAHGGSRVEEHSFKERLAASGGLVTSIEDLAKLLTAQMKPGVFTSEMLFQLQTETKLSNGSPSGTALGWSIRSIDGVGRILEKNGGRSNCSAWIGFSPEHRVGVAIITNCGGPDVDPIGRELLERSIPSSRKKLVTKDGYAKVAPYTGVRWEMELPIVCVQDRWSPLVSIDGIPIDRIMEFANKEYGAKALKRFAEDLVKVLSDLVE